MTIVISKRQLMAISVIVLSGVGLGILIVNLDPPTPHSEHPHEQHETHAHAGHQHHEDEDASSGPHGGQLFSNGDFAAEVLLAEAEDGARLRIYLNRHGQAINADAATVSMQLMRGQQQQQRIDFASQSAYLDSVQIIEEPHIFQAQGEIRLDNHVLPFALSEQEGLIAFSDEQIVKAGIKTAVAGPAEIAGLVTLPGEIHFNEDQTSHVVPRLNGVVEAIAVNLGDQVKKGQVLIVIASTELAEMRSALLSARKRLDLARAMFERERHLWQAKISAEQDFLQAQQTMQEAEIEMHNAQQKLAALGAQNQQSTLNRYEIRAPFDGMVVEKHAALGEAVKADASLFTISDLSSVWAEIQVSAKDLHWVRVGSKARIHAVAFDSKAEGRVSYVGSLMGEQTRTAIARITLANPEMAWRPGLFTRVQIETSQSDVPVTVVPAAIQTVNGEATVFQRVAGGFIAQAVTTGLSNDRWLQIVSGLEAGNEYAADGSFIIKSEQGKHSAEHSH